jgi:hypothetical protein
MSTMRTVDRRTILRLAAEGDLDPRSARKALIEGPDALRGRAGERAREAMERLGLQENATASGRNARPAA